MLTSSSFYLPKNQTTTVYKRKRKNQKSDPITNTLRSDLIQKMQKISINLLPQPDISRLNIYKFQKKANLRSQQRLNTHKSCDNAKSTFQTFQKNVKGNISIRQLLSLKKKFHYQQKQNQMIQKNPFYKIMKTRNKSVQSQKNISKQKVDEKQEDFNPQIIFSNILISNKNSVAVRQTHSVVSDIQITSKYHQQYQADDKNESNVYQNIKQYYQTKYGNNSKRPQSKTKQRRTVTAFKHRRFQQ